jgi:hypothetical protein
MSPSRSEEIIAIGWFILSCHLRGPLRWICIGFGSLSLIAAFTLSIK